MKIKVVLNKSAIEKKLKNIQTFVDKEVMKRMEPYIPIDTGTTTADMYMSTVPGEGKVKFLGSRLNPRSNTFNRDYLTIIYNGRGTRFKGYSGPVGYSGYSGGAVHGRATARWFDVMKANELNGIKNSLRAKFGFKDVK
jgi:hypothetical protein